MRSIYHVPRRVWIFFLQPKVNQKHFGHKKKKPCYLWLSIYALWTSFVKINFILREWSRKGRCQACSRKKGLTFTPKQTILFLNFFFISRRCVATNLLYDLVLSSECENKKKTYFNFIFTNYFVTKVIVPYISGSYVNEYKLHRAITRFAGLVLRGKNTWPHQRVILSHLRWSIDCPFWKDLPLEDLICR